MNMLKMTDEEFADSFLQAILRKEPMAEEDITAALGEANEIRIGACLLQMLLDGEINARWEEGQLYWSSDK